MNKVYKQIYKEIKRAKKIVLARHVGPDPDALGSTLGLKEVILSSFNDKEVYVVGAPASRFKFLGMLDKYDSSMNDALLIVLDTPDMKRIDGVNPADFKSSIKIDHHPFIEKICDFEWIDDKASSACQMVIELVLNTRLCFNKRAGECLYTGLVADTNRFMFKYSTSKTFYLVSYLLSETGIDITEIYNNLYIRPYREIKFQGYISENFVITGNKVGYIVINDDVLKEYNVDVASAGNMINNFNFIDDMLVWMTCTLDKDSGCYRVSVRSRGPIINETLSHFGGGGHIYASGARLKSTTEIENLVKELDLVVQKYISSD